MVRLISGLAYLALLSNAIDATSLPDSDNALSILEAHAGIAPRSADIIAPENALERRKGGGGRGGGGSGGGSSSGGRGGGGGSSGRSSVTSNYGGSTRSGSGASRGYGGGGYYAGGAAVPYTAGQKSFKNGLPAGPLLVGAGALAIMPGLWLYSVYPYYYNNPYRFYNRSANATEHNNNRRSLFTRQQQMGANQTLDVICLCEEFNVCGCEENDDQKYLDDLIGNGSYAALNKSVVTVSEVNNTRKLILNGTLPNGTTAPGGEDDAGASLSVSGYWVMCLIVLYGVML
jgi:hypothetical protein